VSAVRGATGLCSGIKTSPELAVFANGVTCDRNPAA
jgi:hypothetical protein